MFHYLAVIIVFLIVLWLVIGVHELGHLLVAKLLGIKVICYSIGFGHKLFRFRSKKGTEYAISAIPLGGYVKLLDEREGYVSPFERKYAFNRQPGIKKIAVLMAGIILNMLLGLTAYWGMFCVGYTTVMPVIGRVAPKSIAAQAGLSTNDKITAIGSRDVADWHGVVMNFFRFYGDSTLLNVTTEPFREEGASHVHKVNLSSWKMDGLNPDPLESLGITPYTPTIPAVIHYFNRASMKTERQLKIDDQVIAVNHKKIADWDDLMKVIRQKPGEMAVFSVRREGRVLDIPLKIGTSSFFGLKKTGHLGIGNDFRWPPEFTNTNKFSMGNAFVRASQETESFVVLNAVIIGKFLMGKLSLQSLGGPVSIFLTTDTAVHIGFSAVLNVIAFINLTLAIVNFLPIPGLDGGQIVFTLIEMVRRKPLALRVQLLFYQLGMILILVLFFVAIVNDVSRLVIT